MTDKDAAGTLHMTGAADLDKSMLRCTTSSNVNACSALRDYKIMLQAPETSPRDQTAGMMQVGQHGQVERLVPHSCCCEGMMLQTAP